MAENRRKSAVSTYLLLFVLALVFAAAAVLLLPVYRSYQKKQAELGTLNEQDLLALNNTLGKPVSTAPESVAPENPEQEARVEKMASGQAPQAQPASVHKTTR